MPLNINGKNKRFSKDSPRFPLFCYMRKRSRKDFCLQTTRKKVNFKILYLIILNPYFPLHIKLGHILSFCFCLIPLFTYSVCKKRRKLSFIAHSLLSKAAVRANAGMFLDVPVLIFKLRLNSVVEVKYIQRFN